VLDFDDFLKLGGCKKGSHLFTETASTADGNVGEEESVECRFDFYQTPTSVIVSIFAKKVDQDNSIIKFGTSGVGPIWYFFKSGEAPFLDSKLVDFGPT
jgi:hypothetical protein